PYRSLVPRQRLQGTVDHRSFVAAGAACDRLRSSRLGLEIAEGPSALIAASYLGSGYKGPSITDHL
ncbi:hypothetical protein, partial [Pseudomonas karstica]|uniref:hypothetical protein n=1 Tax=Pseudomonas karstica TaxID=1055468 RepID=UPI00362258E0